MLKNNPHYFGYFWDLMIENSEIFSLKNLENAIRKNTSPIYDEQELFEAHTLDADRMRRFTHAIPSLSVGSASVWPRCPPRSALDIADQLLDVGVGPAQLLPSLGYYSIVTAQKTQA
ncbi:MULTISPECIES: hypothetical protein [Serratia]|uniref:hypothetical protein n=1 Tax=Serratia TaxID=613 RepID=UPI003204AFEB